MPRWMTRRMSQNIRLAQSERFPGQHIRPGRIDTLDSINSTDSIDSIDSIHGIDGIDGINSIDR